ncbi:MAG: tRNA(Ile)-lysidine synthetase-like protein [Pseudohongiellaceae bacterium]|jgi:tRNA(Ile)-lysidine synthetase-like protein
MAAHSLKSSRPASLPVPEQVLSCLSSVAQPGDQVLVAVSGGSDSVALLGAVAQVWPRVAAVHVHHGLRDAADGDAQLVEQLCAELEIPLQVVHAPPRTDRDRSETSARTRRLDALAATATTQNIPWILTAHHLDDAVETALLNLRRGHRGARAVAGIPTLRPARPGSSRGAPRYLRPFLFGPAASGRSQLSQWREGADLPAAYDESNDDLTIPRNELRALLARDQAPLTRARLVHLRTRAQREIQGLVGRATELLSEHLSAEGLGARLDRRALETGHEPGQLVECLRLLGPCLQPLHQLTLRTSVLKRLTQGIARERGQLLLPGFPEPLRALCRGDGLHFPEITVAPGDGPARVMAALWSTPLFL